MNIGKLFHELISLLTVTSSNKNSMMTDNVYVPSSLCKYERPHREFTVFTRPDFSSPIIF